MLSTLRCNNVCAIPDTVWPEIDSLQRKKCVVVQKNRGEQKKAPAGGLFCTTDWLVNSLLTSPANASDENSTCRLVVNVAHRVGGLAEDHGLNAECIDDSDTGSNLFVDKHL